MILASILAASALSGASCRAVDGDTLRCGAERIRLSGIDAPELPGHCARRRACAPGDPHASKAALARLMRGRAITLRRLGTDHYGRTLALVYADGVNLSCAQLRAGHAVHVAKWDDGGLLRRECVLTRK
ncbi:MAG: thermonuclease family protein [Sphingobium sp.]|nr:thermonuclease family protein [Sphingobium sp.]MBP6111715.1 thermonuclease family protein [Sphingobium sp.]MBP8671604.1 thermonuclease family protein [Sphingobium sp.]MBP9158632.1 thermonuclease family protein [Sphingobium sp.]MCC6482444.1 thermonuclease family protein [Sphingomonadaceae bacterium]